jgi:titin
LPTYTSGTTDATNGSVAALIQTNFTLPDTGNKSPNGSVYYLATSTTVRARIPQISGTWSARPVFVTCGTSPGSTDLLNASGGGSTTSSYQAFSSSTTYVMTGGTTYYAGPRGDGGSIQSPRSLNNSGFNIYHNGSIPPSTGTGSITQPTSSQTYFAIDYNGVPSRPTGFTAGAATATEVNFTWTAPSSNGGSPVLGFLIQRSTDGVNFGNTQTITGNVTSGKYTGLTANTDYYFRIAAYNNVRSKSTQAISEWSNVTPVVKTGTASAGVTGTMTAPVNSQTQVTLTGNITNSKTTAVSLTIDGGGTISPSTLNIAAGATLGFTATVTNLSGGTEYTFNVKEGTTVIVSDTVTTQGEVSGDVTLSFVTNTTTAVQISATVKNPNQSTLSVLVSADKGTVNPSSYTVSGVDPAAPAGTVVQSIRGIVVSGLPEGTTSTTVNITVTAVYPSGNVIKGISASTKATDPASLLTAPTFSTASYLAAGEINKDYSAQVSATGASGYTIVYSKVDGPTWASVSPNGFITGKPTTAGMASVRVKAAYSGVTNSPETIRTFFISVSEQAPYWSPENQTINSQAFLNQNYLSAFNAENIVSELPYEYLGILPPGITFNQTTGDFSGKPTRTGRYDNIYVRARGKDGSVISKGPYTIQVYYPGARRTESGSWELFANGFRYAPGEEGANFNGWKPLTFMKRFNGTSWVDVNDVI